MATLFSHYKSMGIFFRHQGQLTAQSVVGSGQTFELSEFSCISLLSASMKRIGLKTAEKSGDTVFAIITLSVAMETSGLIWPNQLWCMSSLPVSMKMIPSRTTEKKWQHSFSNYNTICCHGNPWSNLAEFRTHPSFYAYPHCLEV